MKRVLGLGIMVKIIWETNKHWHIWSWWKYNQKSKIWHLFAFIMIEYCAINHFTPNHTKASGVTQPEEEAYINLMFTIKPLPDEKNAPLHIMIKGYPGVETPRFPWNLWCETPYVEMHSTTSGLILGLLPANEGRCYKVTPSLIGWPQTYNQYCTYPANERRRYKVTQSLIG